MALALPWLFIFGARSRRQRISGAILMLAGEAACLYTAFNADMLSNQYGFLSGGLQIAVALTLLVVTLEMARRAIGWPLPLVEIGRASCRERVCQTVLISVVAVSLKKKK